MLVTSFSICNEKWKKKNFYEESFKEWEGELILVKAQNTIKKQKIILLYLNVIIFKIKSSLFFSQKKLFFCSAECNLNKCTWRSEL